MGISIGQSSSHCPQLTQESEIWANRLRWNMELGGSSPGLTIRGFFFVHPHSETDRAVLNTGVALDAPGSLLHDLLQTVLAFAKCVKVVLAPLVAKLDHCTLDFAPDLKTLGVRCFGCKDTGFHRTAYEVCTLLAADFDEGCLTGLVADDTPVPAGKVCLAGDFILAAAAVGPASVACFFEFVDGDALVSAFVLDDELSLVDLFLVDLVRVNPEFIGNHLAGEDRADRTTAVDTDHDDVVKVDLLALGKLVESPSRRNP